MIPSRGPPILTRSLATSSGYHYQHSGDHGATGLALLASGQHECLVHTKSANASRHSTPSASAAAHAHAQQQQHPSHHSHAVRAQQMQQQQQPMGVQQVHVPLADAMYVDY